MLTYAYCQEFNLRYVYGKEFIKRGKTHSNDLYASKYISFFIIGQEYP